MDKNCQQLWQDVASTSDEGKAVRTLAKIVLDKLGRTFILGLERNCAELCMEILDRVSRDPYPLHSCCLRLFPKGIAEHKLKATEKQVFFVVLRRLAAIHGRLPESMMIMDEIKVSDEVLASGGFADVRTGTYKGCLVAVKTMRIAKQDDLLKIRRVSVHDILGHLRYGSDRPSQQFCREVILWNTLSHPNILKLKGVQGDMDRGQLITISEWMTRGNIMEYIRKNQVNRLELVRGPTVPATPFTEVRKQLHGAAQGLSYLHDCAGLTHGDLKGVSVSLPRDRFFLTFNRRTSSCPTATLHVPASWTSVL